ncbi:MAG: metallophosphoesterase [Phascolarctobacterium sp.]|nr:metallophosphoesterase [Phascolarctobacterium sp.]
MFCKYMATLAVLLSLFLNGCSNNGQDSGSDKALGIYNVRQIVAENNKTSRTIMWNSKAKQNDYELELRLQGDKKLIPYKAKDYSFKDGKGEYIQYGSLLTDLKAGEKYEYRINQGKAKGSWHKLKADNGKSFKALVYPDTQCSDYSFWHKVSIPAYERNKDVDLYLHLGDLTDNGEDNYQWEQWFKGVEGYSDSVPFAPTIGNHETYNLKWKVRYPNAYVKLFNLPENGLEKYRHQFYSFDYGPVHFAVIDTNGDKEMKEMQPTLEKEQLAWLEKDLAKSKAKWKVVMQHKDILLYKFAPDSGRTPRWETHFREQSKALIPIYEKYKVDVVLSAHLHTYRRRKPLLNFEPNPLGITYIMTGIAGNVQYAKLWENWEHDAARAPYPETMNYLTMTADEGKLHFECFLPDGKKIDEVTITKK